MESIAVCLEEDVKKNKNLEEISRRPGWHGILRDGGGDIDLADYPSDYQTKKVINYDNLP